MIEDYITTSTSLMPLSSQNNAIDIAVKYVNSNEGLFSLVLSVIAIIVSIVAIRAQNKGVVFEQRLKLYCMAMKAYANSCSILIQCAKESDDEKKREIISCYLFSIDSKEKKIMLKYKEHVKQYKDLVDDDKKGRNSKIDFIAEYVRHLETDTFIQEAKIYYSRRVIDSVIDMYSQYDKLRLGVLFGDMETINVMLCNLSDTVEKVKNKKSLDKMKRKLPL